MARPPNAPYIIGVLATSAIIPFLLPPPFVRILPLLGSVIFFQWCYDEHYALLPYLSTSMWDGESRIDHNRLIGKWYSRWFESLGPVPSAGALPLTVISTSINLYRLYSHLGKMNHSQRDIRVAALAWTAGLALFVYHMPYGGGGYFALLEHVKAGSTGKDEDNAFPLIGKSRVKVPKGDIEARVALKTWLEMHGRRLWLIDFPAVICMGIATAAIL